METVLTDFPNSVHQLPVERDSDTTQNERQLIADRATGVPTFEGRIMTAGASTETAEVSIRMLRVHNVYLCTDLLAPDHDMYSFARGGAILTS